MTVGDALLTGFASGKLAAIGLRDGRALWEIPVAQPQGRSEIERLVDVDAPVLLAGRLLVSAAYQGKIVAVNLENGRLLWSRDISTYSAMAADGGNVYVSDDRGHIYALDLRSGATVWKQEQLQGRRPSAPAVVGPAGAVGDLDGYVHWLVIAMDLPEKPTRLYVTQPLTGPLPPDLDGVRVCVIDREFRAPSDSVRLLAQVWRNLIQRILRQ